LYYNRELMCGIFGFVSEKEKSASEIIKGLKILEYRGYDSWGIAIKNGPLISVEKKTGEIKQEKSRLKDSKVGVGHTRWATHGGVTLENAHPHLDCSKKIAVVHNGIVENYFELKENLLTKKHKFNSETDTEVIAHLIEENLKKTGFASSVRSAFNKLSGMNAIVVMNSVSSQIIAAKSGSPLVVGRTKNAYYIASDVLPMLKLCDDFLFLKDNQMVILGDKLELVDLSSGKKQKPNFEKINWTINEAEKGKFKHFMLKEIFEQPAVIRSLELGSKENIETLVKLMKKAFGTFFIGAGTAHFASIAGEYLFSKIAKEHINTLPASEFNYLESFLKKGSLIIALSQSGETIDVVEPLQRAKEKGCKVFAMTNVQNSTIYRIADYKMLLMAGPEKAVASTKAYIAKLAILLLTAFAFSNKLSKGKEILIKTAVEIESILKPKNLLIIKKLAQKLKNREHIYIIGRGPSYASALEAALKIKEVSYIHAEGLAGGELKHGSLALIEKGTPCLVFAPSDETYSAIISNATEIKARGGYIVGISFKDDPVFDYFIKVNNIEEGSYIAQIVPIQLLSYYLSLLRHCNPDKPRNLAKSVTVR
jgi:glutamine---fructose-6-phosphate transaminase (isomerizing)